jgi:hypothetical protein
VCLLSEIKRRKIGVPLTRKKKEKGRSLIIWVNPNGFSYHQIIAHGIKQNVSTAFYQI